LDFYVIEAKPNKEPISKSSAGDKKAGEYKTEEVPEPAVPLDSTEKEFDASVSHSI
jgi:hypothetical protein